MERNLIFDEKPEFIVDLGSGYSNIHMNVKEVEFEEYDQETETSKRIKKWQADVQRVKNPVTYEKTVNSAIKDEFPDGEDAAALRKGIVNPKDKDFMRLNAFAEYVKKMFKSASIKSESKVGKYMEDFWSGVK